MKIFTSTKRNFQNLGKMILLMFITGVPILNAVAFGYIVSFIRKKLSKEISPLKWKNYKTMLIDGLKFLAIQFVYGSPVIMLLLFLYATGEIIKFEKSPFFLFIVYALLTVVSAPAILYFARTKNFRKTFDLHEIKSFLNFNLILACVKSGIITLIMSFILTVFIGAVGVFAVIYFSIAMGEFVKFVGSIITQPPPFVTNILVILNFAGTFIIAAFVNGISLMVSLIIFWSLVLKNYRKIFTRKN